MQNLLSAGFMRLRKSRLFWLFIAAETAWGAFLAWMLYYYIGENITISAFMPMFYLCIVEAVFCGFFIGTDYSDGTVRNKLTVGQTRENIYLSNLIICSFAGAAVFLTHITVFLAVGLLFIGPVIVPTMLFIKVLCAIFNVVACASLFTMISMLCSKIATATVTNIFVSLGTIVAGVYAFAFYSEPKYLPDGTANYRYIGGAARAVLWFFESVLPSSSALVVMAHNSYSVCLRVILCSVAEAAIFTLIGLWAFGRKNIN